MNRSILENLMRQCSKNNAETIFVPYITAHKVKQEEPQIAQEDVATEGMGM